MRIALYSFGVLSLVGLAACNDPGRGPSQSQTGYAQPATVAGGGISSTGSTTAVTTTTTTIPGTVVRDPFVGNWTGVLPSGAPIQVVIPSSGVTPMYYFRGESQPIGLTEMRGQTMRASFVRPGDGYIELTPQADGRLVFFFNSNQTTANLVLSRS